MTRRRRRVWSTVVLALFAVTATVTGDAIPRPILFDEDRCPCGWSSAGAAGVCVQLQFEPRRVAEAAGECRKLGAQLVRLRLNDNAGDTEAILLELSHLINDVINKGVSELTWTIGRVESGAFTTRTVKRTRVPLLKRLTALTRREKRDSNTHKEDGKHFALRKKENDDNLFEIVELSAHSAHPFICALSPLKQKALLYEEALLPNGSPHIMDESPRRTPYHHFVAPWPNTARANVSASAEDASAGHSYFVRLPCRAIGTPMPRIRWFHTDQNDEIDVSMTQSRYLISGGALYINISESSSAVTSFYCTATNKHAIDWRVIGTVRSATAVVRPVFMEPFRASRADVFPLSVGGGRPAATRVIGLTGAGTRIECDTPRHYPKSYTFSWVYGSSNEQFLSVDERIFVSMDGTLYFSYNIAEDANQYSCILVLPVTQSAQHGPFFRLVLPQFHQLNPPRQHSFAPRIDDFQPSVFPELPLRGETAYIECFAYGYPLPSYKWSRADGLTMSRRHRVTNYGRVLRIDAVELADAVRYRCTARNELGVASAEVQLTVRSRPVILRAMSDTLVAHNESVVFRCETHVGGNVGASLSRTTVEWFHNGRPLVPLLLSRSDRKRVKLSKKELWIQRVQANDAGVYQCLVTNDIGSSSTAALLIVQNVAPHFHANIFPSRVFVAEGTSVQLPCFYQASPRGRSYWRRVDTSESVVSAETVPTLLTLEDDANAVAVLRLDAVDSADSGLYECVAVNVDGTAQARINVTVLAPAEMRVQVNVGNRFNEDMEVSCEVEIDCDQKDSCPEALFDWKFNDKSIRLLSNSQSETAQITQSEQILPNDGKALSIQTVASNEKELSETKIFNWHLSKIDSNPSSDKLIVMEKPDDSKPTTDSQSFFYSPNAGGTTMQPKRLLYRSELRLAPSFVAGNAGRFACQSAFGVGAVAELAPPSMIGAIATNVRAELLDLLLSPQPDDDGLEDELVLSEFGEYTASLSWRQPKDYDHSTRSSVQKISGYEIEFRTARHRRWRSAQHVPGSSETLLQSIILRGLEPNQRYQFRIRTKSFSDAPLSVFSTLSSPSEWLTTPKCAPLEDVAAIRHTPLDDTHILIEWEPIEMDYSTGDELRYNVSWHWTDSMNGSDVVDGTSLLLIVPIATVGDCTQLAIGVRPFNEMGEGRYATNTVLPITSIGPRRRAQNARLSTVNSTHLNLTWEWTNVGACESVHGTHISCDEVKAVPIAADVKYKSTAYRNIYDVVAEAAVSQAVPSQYSQWLVHGLRASTAYRCRLTPFDRHGRWGASGASTVASTAGPAPRSAPEITYVYSTRAAGGGFSVTLEWSAVPFNVSGPPITGESKAAAQTVENDEFESADDYGYRLFVYMGESAVRPTELSLSAAQLFDATRPSARIDGLRRIFTYRIQIAGFNEGGMGPLSSPFLVRVDPSATDFLDVSSGTYHCYSKLLLIIAFSFIMYFC